MSQLMLVSPSLLFAISLLNIAPQIDAESCPEPTLQKVAEVKRYVTKFAHFSSSDDLTITQNIAANNGCFRKLTFSSSGGKEFTFYLSPDGRYLTPALFDIKEDPLMEELRRVEIVRAALRAGSPSRKGEDNAPVQIAEFSDFQCPFCKKQAEILEREVLPKAGSRVQLIFHNFPLDIHPWAEEAAQSARCAYAQHKEAFWAVHDFLFTNQPRLSKRALETELPQFVRSNLVEIDSRQFETCLYSGETLNEIRSDERLGRRLGVQATPTLFINGRIYKGLRSAQEILKAIDAADAFNGTEATPTVRPTGNSTNSEPADRQTGLKSR